METYRQTHPWITFEAQLRSAPWHLWAMLGECQTLCRHMAGIPLRPQTKQHLYRIYLAKGALASAAIEGNSLTEEQAQAHLQGTLKLPPSQEYLEQEIENIIKACTEISQGIIKTGDTQLTVELIKDFNRTVLANLELEEDVVPGEYPPHEMGVGRYKAAPPKDRDHLLQKLCQWINRDWTRASEATAAYQTDIIFAILKAVYAHLHFEWIHPFGDGNGRTGRLIEFFILISSGIPLPAAMLFSNHYNLTRTEYYRLFDRSSKSEEHVIAFLCYAIRGFLDGLTEQQEFIRQQQIDVAWRNYIYETFRDLKASDSARRKRRLVLDLSRQTKPVQKSKLAEISPTVAKYYATKTEKTMSRDLKDLQKMKLIRWEKNGFIANKELILAFLPLRHDPVPVSTSD